MSKWIWYVIIVVIALLMVLYIFNIKISEDNDIEYNYDIGGKYQIVTSDIKEDEKLTEISFALANNSSDTINILVNKLDFNNDEVTLREKQLQSMGDTVIEISFIDTVFQDKDKIEFLGDDTTRILKKIVCYTPEDNQTSIVYLICNDNVNIEITRNIDNVEIKLFR